jgi:hypothetical protein
MMMMEEANPKDKDKTSSLNPCLNKNEHARFFTPIKVNRREAKNFAEKTAKPINFLSCCFMCTSHLIMSYSSDYLFSFSVFGREFSGANLCRLEVETAAIEMHSKKLH